MENTRYKIDIKTIAFFNLEFFKLIQIKVIKRKYSDSVVKLTRK